MPAEAIGAKPRIPVGFHYIFYVNGHVVARGPRGSCQLFAVDRYLSGLADGSYWIGLAILAWYRSNAQLFAGINPIIQGRADHGRSFLQDALKSIRKIFSRLFFG